MWVILIPGISLFTRLHLEDCVECDAKATEREDPEKEQSGAGGHAGQGEAGPGWHRAAGPAGVARLSGGRRCPRVPRRAPPAPRYL